MQSYSTTIILRKYLLIFIMNQKNNTIRNFSVIEKFGMDLGNGGVICLSKDLFPIDKKNYLIPVEWI